MKRFLPAIGVLAGWLKASPGLAAALALVITVVSASSLSYWTDVASGVTVGGTPLAADCTGSTDATSVLQAAFTANPSAHVEVPNGCTLKVSSTITITDGVGPTIEGQTFAGDGSGGSIAPIISWAGTNGGSGCTSTFASCVYIFDFESTDHPVIKNIHFYAGTTSSNCPDGFLKFDGHTGSQIGTNGRIKGNNFDNGNCNNANFVAVNISQTTTQNQENYIVDDNVTGCSGSHASGGNHNGVTNGSTTLTDAMDTPFTSTMGAASFTGVISSGVLTASAVTGTINVGSPISGSGISATFTGTISGTTLSTSAITGTINVGALLVGNGVAPGTTITAILSAGTSYTVSISQTISSGEAMSSNATIVAQLSGSGGAGTYAIIAPNASSEAMTVTGPRIRISYAGGLLDTFIAAYVSTSQVTLSAAPTLWSPSNQTGVTIITSGSLGTAIRVGASQNTLQHILSHNQYNSCAYGIYTAGGNEEIDQATGGYSDVGISLGGFTAQNVKIDYYASENDVQAIVIGNGIPAPVSITDSRFSNGNQDANGHVLFAGNVTFENNLFDFNPPTNGQLIGQSPGQNTAVVTSINNNYHGGISWTSIGMLSFVYPPVTSINDVLDNSTNPGALSWGCFNSPVPCNDITNIFPLAGGVSFDIYGETLSSNATTNATGILSNGNADEMGSFVSIEGRGMPGRIVSQTGIKASWDPTGINGTTWGANSPTSYYDFYAASPASVSGTLPNLYGVYVAAMAQANVTTAYSFYGAGASDILYQAGPVKLATLTTAGLVTTTSGGILSSETSATVAQGGNGSAKGALSVWSCTIPDTAAASTDFCPWKAANSANIATYFDDFTVSYTTTCSTTYPIVEIYDVTKTTAVGSTTVPNAGTTVTSVNASAASAAVGDEYSFRVTTIGSGCSSTLGTEFIYLAASMRN